MVTGDSSEWPDLPSHAGSPEVLPHIRNACFVRVICLISSLRRIPSVGEIFFSLKNGEQIATGILHRYFFQIAAFLSKEGNKESRTKTR